jgi:hypothetical protein
VRRTVQTRYLEPVRHPYGGKRSPLIRMNDWREALVAVAAHEARHLWQFATDARRSEVDAEQFAAQRLAAYRIASDATLAQEVLAPQPLASLKAGHFRAEAQPSLPSPVQFPLF